MKNLNNLFYKNLIEFLMDFKNEIYRLSLKHDLTIMQLMTLISIDLNESLPMNYFKNLFQCDPSNITGIIDALVKKEILTRQESINDRRIKDIKLTPKGIKLQNKLLKAFSLENQSLFKGLTDEEIINFVKFINHWAQINSLDYKV